MDDLVVLRGSGFLIVVAIVLIAVAAIALWGLAGGPLAAQVAFDLTLFIAVVLGYNLFAGTTGYLSFGHGMLYALGGYLGILAANAMASAGWLAGIVAIPVAGLATAMLAIAFMGPLMRVKGPYFAVASLALFLAAGSLVSVVPGLGGSVGLTAVPGVGLNTVTALVAALVLALLGIAGSVLVSKTLFGRRVLAIRDSEEAAASLGLNPALYRAAMLAASGFIVGAAGATYFLSYGGRGYVDPELAFDPRYNTLMVLAAIAGGLGSFTGVVTGAILVKLLDNFLAMYSPEIVAALGFNPSEAPLLVTITPYIVLGSLVALIAIAAPRGIYGLLEGVIERRFAKLVGKATEIVETQRGKEAG
ncbi:inner-membrane translocator [Pyrolobus fumarii 1A]|uniref:Inner-membrane translocator n=1 Tax=Pyrolobus fumarii (strain DSM 11204 / 1A) TaxID=694429 RepID=G0ECV3_PYRF1|nr:branched-chain amino acid ABC transporter permease [Pyrolobus fumarii]AEM39673.1 inner-membrane translocator [Pyrolobus fumarii 1A]